MKIDAKCNLLILISLMTLSGNSWAKTVEEIFKEAEKNMVSIRAVAGGTKRGDILGSANGVIVGKNLIVVPSNFLDQAYMLVITKPGRDMKHYEEYPVRYKEVPARENSYKRDLPGCFVAEKDGLALLDISNGTVMSRTPIPADLFSHPFTVRPTPLGDQELRALVRHGFMEDDAGFAVIDSIGQLTGVVLEYSTERGKTKVAQSKTILDLLKLRPQSVQK